jgi:RND family efflux transporter MFP subunit
MIRNKKFITALIAACIVGGIYHFSANRNNNAERNVRPVATVEVQRASLGHNITLSAELRPYQEIDVHAKVAGYLQSITVDIGDQVKAGQVIAKIETGELKADLDHATAAYHDAKLEYDRINGVIKKRPGLLAQQEVDNAQAAYEMAKANMEHAKTFMDYATITVPFDGVVTKRYADPGAMIQASVSNGIQSMPLVRIAENQRLRLDFPVPEPDVPFVKVGTPVDIAIQATGQKIEGAVARIASAVDSSTRTMQTEVDVDNKDLKIVPGMYAFATINMEQKKDVMTLPMQAVSLGEKPNVWKINDKSEIEEVPVAVGSQTADRVEIVGSLKEGDKVVFGNRDRVSIGMKVEPKLVKQKES